MGGEARGADIGDTPDGADDVDRGLVFLPLGGTGEIGMNLYVYGCDGRWLIVDCGISFGDETTPGVDVLMPDPSFLEQRRDAVVGLVLTHGHEDHFGAIQYLWSRFRCTVYATPFTAAFLRLKLRDADGGSQVPIEEVPLGGSIALGPFGIDFVRMTHSIPEPNALVLRTSYGTVVHSGDWKLDPDPLVGERTDRATLDRLGEEGVLALVCDSTNAMEEGVSGSEADVRTAFTQAFEGRSGRIAVTCFSTNVARINSIAHAAHANGRHCALVGRSLWRVANAAQATGYVDVPEEFVSEEDAGFLPEARIVMVCTGSQGEPRSALSRIAGGDHPNVRLAEGDVVMYSAREIPGNEKAIGRVQDALEKRGIEVMTPDDAPIHVSGHPARDELVQLYQWLKPRIAVPMHGTFRHLRAHARLARTCQVAHALVPEDGMVIRLAPGEPETVGWVQHGRLALDGSRVVRMDNGLVRNRQKLIWQGAVVATVVVDETGELLADPDVTLLGLEESDEVAGLRATLSEDVADAIDGLSDRRARDDDAVRDAARKAVRQGIRSWSGKRPTVEIHLARIQN